MTSGAKPILRAPLLALLIVSLNLLPGVARAATPPQIDSTWTTAVTATAADLRAEVNAEGIDSTYRFEYITSSAYEENTLKGKEGFTGAAKAPPGAEVSLGSFATDQEALQRVGSLKQTTTYRYRIVATNAAGTSFGEAHSFSTQEASSASALPEGRGWELVSPVDKNGGEIQGFGENFGGGVLQAAPNGEAITYSSASSFGEAKGAPPASQYLSRRGVGGWPTENISAPLLSGAYGNEPEGVPYQLFSQDLQKGLLLDGARCEEGQQCPRSYSLRSEADGAFAPSLEAPDLRFAGASPDLSQVIFSTCAALTPEATEVPDGKGGCDPQSPNLYRWSEGPLELINILPGDSKGTPGASLAAQGGAVSKDGSRIYWTDQANNLFLREGAQSISVDEALGAGGSFQTATPDGSLTFFIKEGHLYRYSAKAKATTDLTPTGGGGVIGLLGASEDGSYLYYLTTSGLFLDHNGAITEVAADADASDYPPASGTARLSADGTRLAFLASAPLSGYDNTDQKSGQPDPQLYLYTAPQGAGKGALICVSCNPTNERPLGPSTIPGAIANGVGPEATQTYRPRALSEDGGRLFFNSADALLPADTDAAPDAYEWRSSGVGGCAKPAGCIALLSSAKSPQGSAFIDASADGSDAFFITDASLIGVDPGSTDLYDARVGGGFPEPEPPLPCNGDACQSLPAPPEDPTPPTLAPRAGNSPISFPKKKQRHHHKKHHHKAHHHKGKGHKR